MLMLFMELQLACSRRSSSSSMYTRVEGLHLQVKEVAAAIAIELGKCVTEGPTAGRLQETHCFFLGGHSAFAQIWALRVWGWAVHGASTISPL